MRKLYLHIGTHKTGTTSIQTLVTANDGAFARTGLYVPKAGRPMRRFGTPNVGHHNIAWELNDIPLFQPVDGTFDGLLTEIADANAPSVLLSSEDFEWLHAKPAVLQRVSKAFQELGYQTIVIVYLRAQPEYIQAVYIEGSKSGFLMNYEDVLQEILTNGTYAPDPRVVNRFEYLPLLDAYAEAFGGEHIVVKPYHGQRRPDALLREFIDLLGVAPSLEALAIPPTLNVSPSLLVVLEGMYRTVAARDPSMPDPRSLMQRFPEDDFSAFHQKFDVMSDAEAAAVSERFRADNSKIHTGYGMLVPTAQSTTSQARRDVASKQRRLLDEALTAWQI